MQSISNGASFELRRILDMNDKPAVVESGGLQEIARKAAWSVKHNGVGGFRLTLANTDRNVVTEVYNSRECSQKIADAHNESILRALQSVAQPLEEKIAVLQKQLDNNQQQRVK